MDLLPEKTAYIDERDRVIRFEQHEHSGMESLGITSQHGVNPKSGPDPVSTRHANGQTHDRTQEGGTPGFDMKWPCT